MNALDKTASKHYFGKRGEAFFKGRFGERMRFGRLFQAEYFRPFCNENAVLLDFGCANGLMLRSLPAKRRIGVEVNPQALEECRRLSEAEDIAVELHESLASVADESVDVVISNHCLEHVLDPLFALKEIRRILKAGGEFAMVVPFDDFRARGQRVWRPGSPSNHLFTWCPLNLGNVVTEAGLDVQEARICTQAWSPRIYWVHKTFGMRAFRAACFLLSVLLNRREVFCRARKPAARDGGSAA